jgi:hypothetical protein
MSKDRLPIEHMPKGVKLNIPSETWPEPDELYIPTPKDVVKGIAKVLRPLREAITARIRGVNF